MSQDKILDRIRKLLELSHSTNEHEAAQAAARAAELMATHEVNEAMLQVVTDDDSINAHVSERIVQSESPTYDAERRIAWRDRIASAVARSFGCECYYLSRGLHAIGRESHVQSWTYTCRYLFAEVERLADEAWLVDGADLAAVGQTPRKWKGAFRLGAADVIHDRLYKEIYARREAEQAQVKQLAVRSVDDAALNTALVHIRTSEALAILKKDRDEVQAEFKARTKGFRSTRTMGNSTRYRSGYSAGREAGASISLGGGQKALKS